MKFKVFSFDEIGSTSDKATSLLNEGHKAPFAVLATKQLNGRGRRGRDWVSDEGNIFITLVMPSPKQSIKQMGLLPIKAAIVLADWFFRELGFRPTIKWPNDILFAGCKVAGILCESSVRGNSWGQLNIGIGINVSHFPKTKMEYPVTSISNILNKEIDLTPLQKSLIDFWQNNWDKYDESAISNKFKFFEVGDFQPWWHKLECSDIMFSKGLDSDGSLMLQNVDDQSLISLASVNHEFGWVYQNRNKMKIPLIIADAGNTSLKIYCFDHFENKSISLKLRLNSGKGKSNDEFQGFIKKIREIIPDNVTKWPIFCLSVSDKNKNFLERLCENTFFIVSDVEKRPVLYKLGDYKFSDLGIDRLVLMEGWLTENKTLETPKELAVLVSAGTATTIDVITKNGVHLGGLILPGMQTSLDALADVATLLPNIDLEKNKENIPGLGKDTKTSMSSAVLQMTLGAIERVQAQACKEKGIDKENSEVIVTGGFSELIESIEYRRNSTLFSLGAKSMILGGVIN